MQKTVLIVDDERALRTVMRDCLERESYKVLEASTGHEGIDLMRAEPVDVLLLDVMMPGISGIEVAKYIQKTDTIKHKPQIVMLTNKGDMETVAEAVSANAFTYVIKSDSSLTEVVEMVADIMNGLEE